MRITLESTATITSVDGQFARVWHGTTEQGTPIVALIVVVAARATADVAELERELREVRAPQEIALLDALSILPE